MADAALSSPVQGMRTRPLASRWILGQMLVSRREDSSPLAEQSTSGSDGATPLASAQTTEIQGPLTAQTVCRDVGMPASSLVPCISVRQPRRFELICTTPQIAGYVTTIESILR